MLEILDHVEHLNREMWFLRRGHDAGEYLRILRWHG